MALVRIGISPVLSRVSYAVTTSSKFEGNYSYGDCAQKIHLSGAQKYPEVPSLPLPSNVSEIFANETSRFTPERSRDIAAPVFLFGGDRSNRSNFPEICDDSRVESYDWSGAISLNGSMQSNVPKPFCSSGKSTHLNMPGGKWARDDKYIAEDMQKSQYGCSPPRLATINKVNGCAILSGSNSLRRTCLLNHISRMNYSLSWDEQKLADKLERKQMSKKELVKKYTLEFGKSFIVIHIGISLISLAGCYVAVKSGMDLMPFAYSWMDAWNVDDYYRDMVKNSQDFALAYLIHKMLFPVRFGTTFFVTPIFTTYLMIGGKYIGGKLSPLLKTSPVHPKLKKLKNLEELGEGKKGQAINEAPKVEVKEIKEG